MPLIRVKDIRDMSPDSRMERLFEYKTELVRLKTMIRAGGTVENPGRIRQLRRAVARIMTIEAEGKIKQRKEKTEAPAEAEQETKKKTEKKRKKKRPEKTDEEPEQKKEGVPKKSKAEGKKK